MHRRLFLAGASGALASLPLAAFAVPQGGSSDDVCLLRTYVANRDQFPHAKAPGAEELLRLERQPHRTFDPASIGVRRNDGSQLGYLPPASTGLLATLLDEGFVAYAVTLPGTGTGALDLQVQVYLKKDLSGVDWVPSA